MPNVIVQRRDPGVPVWLPAACAECLTFNEAEQARIDGEKTAAAARAAEERRITDLRATGLPEPYVVGKRGEESLLPGPDSASYRTARAVCSKLLTGQLPAPWVYLCGDNGTNKSTLACVTLLKALQAGLPGRYLLWPDALDELRSLNRDDAKESVSSYVDRLVKVPRLVIDEIGFGTPTPFAAEKLFLVFEKRYQLDSAADPGRRWIIFTSNRSVEQLVKSFAPFDEFFMAPRLERRIAEMSTEVAVTR